MNNRAVRMGVRIALLLLAAGSSLHAQSADEIIKRHIKALGGEKALRAVQTVRLEGTAHINGETRPFVWQLKKPDLYYIEVQAPQGAVIESFNGRTAWRDDPAEGLRSLSGHEQGNARASGLFRNDHFLTYKKEKTKLRMLGPQRMDGQDVLAIEMTTRAGVQRRLYFFVKDNLLFRESQEREDAHEEITYGDYRAVDGVLEPFRITYRRGGVVWDATVREAKHNAGVDAQAFHIPNRSNAPLPDFSALLQEVEKNQKNVEKLRENYTYLMVQTSTEVDSKGYLKQKSERTYEVFYLGGWQVNKLVKKDGQPLRAEEAQKEEKRVEKIIHDWEERRKKDAQKQAKMEQQKASGKKPEEDDKDDISVSDFLRICQLVNPRRERYRGQEVIVFEFEPKAGYKARSRSESLVQKLAGAIWIDEKAKEIARLEARLTDSFKMGGGLLVSVGRGSAFVFEQEIVKNEVWLPSYAEISASARVLLFKGYKVNSTMRFSDYKKFNVETLSDIKPPKQ